MSGKKVLIIDDEEDILKLIQTVLKKEGIEHVWTSTTAKDGLAQFQEKKPDLVLLDIMLPDGEGYEVCKQIRGFSKVPILFISAKTEEIDKILGFAIGGDDYITKPFSPKELAYRVKAQLRRADYAVVEPVVEEDPVLKAGPFELDPQKAELLKNGSPIDLKPKELGLMKVFLANANKVISKEKLYDTVWGEDFIGIDNTVMVHIRRLREKIEDQPSSPEYLITVKGLGYKLVIEEQ
ncbi:MULTISPECIES: response regulator transcription factor [Brevibacillus]|jgi:Response regulators consisting of a CheY-like receiver domain and a winged-helix DNA-binding domain|uniref:DNA-binding response regulator n=1 Tax=Brevibacillus parabrevis TaxID=54914 RepID=A0A4Y3PMG2_BREPA|nr:MULTISPECIES: response regulator transcription factor [Brevibacillus]MBU8713247.1 response regulator transcription factor [Brevibacillus parabrevis]MDH6351575.1 DNA-binding response OmpR family regulator [Brevibacillus sp. 1238]MED2255746.1 response regulator transcription factor [Brevibacillus parabrevis]RNB97451.1 DNA-binding response regulator [Brevibacillus parabrevis]UED69082.1 response regulator transcription factor [Brevibacillus sp. HD3.3A]